MVMFEARIHTSNQLDQYFRHSVEHIYWRTRSLVEMFIQRSRCPHLLTALWHIASPLVEVSKNPNSADRKALYFAIQRRKICLHCPGYHLQFDRQAHVCDEIWGTIQLCVWDHELGAIAKARRSFCQKPSVPIVGIAPSKDGGVIRVPDNLFLHSDECSFAFAIQHGHIDPKEPKKAVWNIFKPRCPSRSPGHSFRNAKILRIDIVQHFDFDFRFSLFGRSYPSLRVWFLIFASRRWRIRQ